MVEIDAFRDFATYDAEQDGAAAVVACCAEGFQGERRFLGIGGFDENEFGDGDMDAIMADVDV